MDRIMGATAVYAILLFGCEGVTPPTPPAPAHDAGQTVDSGPQTDAAATADVRTSADAGADAGRPDTGIICDEADLSALYTRYVEPFVSGAQAQSCSQCHLTGVDLSLYVQDTPCQTMACMIGRGLVDLDDPESSNLLAQIMLGDPNSSVYSVAAEHQAMLEWINFSARCHNQLCGVIDNACASGTGSAATGRSPIGDCSEDDLLTIFWDAVIVDRNRCVSCHSVSGAERGTFGPCSSAADCEGNQVCVGDLCRAPGPLSAPHFFEGSQDRLVYSNLDHRRIGLNTMYNILALNLVDTDQPLASPLLAKPLLEGFQPTAVYGRGVAIEEVPAGVGVGLAHGGASKFNFGCTQPPCRESGVVDCRQDRPCSAHAQCRDGERCRRATGPANQRRYCRLARSVCDETYVNTLRFALELARCGG